VRNEAGEIAAAEGRQRLAVCLGHEQVGAGRLVAQALVQVPAGGEGVGHLGPAHEGGVVAVARRHLLHRAAEQHHGVGRGEADGRLEGELALAGAELHLHRAQRQAELLHGAADVVECRLHLVVALLGQILVALGDEAHLRRLAGLGGVGRRHARIVELEDMELDLEAGHEFLATRCKLVECHPQDLPAGERHRPAVLKIEVAQHPAALVGPGQHLEGGRVGDHDDVGGALQLAPAHAAAGREHREYGAMRGVLEDHGRGDHATVGEGSERLLGHQRLAAQHAVLVGEREPERLQTRGGDGLPHGRHRLFLGSGP
jgi:hypothetical protein